MTTEVEQNPLIREFQQVVQQRIDELYVLEKKAKERETELQDKCITLASVTKSVLDKVGSLHNDVDNSMSKIREISEIVNENLKISAKRIWFSIKVSVVAVLIAVFCIFISLLVVKHFYNTVALVIQHKHNSTYVRVKPDSEVKFYDSTNGTLATFAKID